MPQRVSSGGTKRRNRSNALLGSALVAISVVAGAIIISGYSRPAAVVATAAPVVGEFDTVRIPVPVDPVPAGTRVQDIRLKSVAFPSHQVPAGALRTVDEVREAVAIAALPANLPLFRENFSLTAHTSNPVLERIPEGMRAMTIRVDATSAVEGWAGSGSVVDVLLIEKDRSTVIAEKVKILSAERSVSPVEGASAPSVPSTVTILVTQEQCLAINTAIPMGRIAFALRGARDERDWVESSFAAAQLRNGSSEVRAQSDIRGYVSVHGEQDKQGFALVGGKWIRADAKPEGFLVNSGEK